MASCMFSCSALPGENFGNTRLGVSTGGGVCGFRTGLSAGWGWDNGAAGEGLGADGVSFGSSGAGGAGAASTGRGGANLRNRRGSTFITGAFGFGADGVELYRFRSEGIYRSVIFRAISASVGA